MAVRARIPLDLTINRAAKRRVAVKKGEAKNTP
jgi:hypothetical protein